LIDREKTGKGYKVRYNNEGKLFWSCNMVTNRGFPCIDLWKVNCYLERNNLSLIPIVARWTKDYGNQIDKAFAVGHSIESDEAQKNSVSSGNYDNEEEAKTNRIYRYITIPESNAKKRRKYRKIYQFYLRLYI